MLWVSDSRIILPEQSIEWNILWKWKPCEILFHLLSLKKKQRHLFPEYCIKQRPPSADSALPLEEELQLSVPMAPVFCLSVCKAEGRAAVRGVNRGRCEGGSRLQGPAKVSCLLGPQIFPVFSSSLRLLPSFFGMSAYSHPEQRC